MGQPLQVDVWERLPLLKTGSNPGCVISPGYVCKYIGTRLQQVLPGLPKVMVLNIAEHLGCTYSPVDNPQAVKMLTLIRILHVLS